MNDARSMTDDQIEKAIAIGPNRQVKLSIATIIGVSAMLLGGAAGYFSIIGQLKSLEGVPDKLNELDKRLYALELRQAGNITNTSAGGAVHLGPQESRRSELRKQAELKTAELAELLGVTNETITNRIEKDQDGEPLYYRHGDERYPVRRLGNTFIISNPFVD